MGKRGYYGPCKRGSGLIYLYAMCFDKVNNREFVIGLGSPSSYPFEHPLFGDDNFLILGSGFNKVKHTHIAHSNNYIYYKSSEERDARMLKAKSELESLGYEVIIK